MGTIPSQTHVFGWAKKIESGRESVTNIRHNWRPRSIVNKGVLLIDFLRDQRMVNFAEFCQLLEATKAA